MKHKNHMKLHYGPCLWNPHAAHHFPGCFPNTLIEVINENTIKVDNETYEFYYDSVSFPNIREQTNGVIEEAFRKDGILHIVVRRFFTQPGGELEWYTEDFIERNT